MQTQGDNVATGFAQTVDIRTLLDAIKGQRHAQHQLYQQFYGPVMRLALAMMSNGEEAKDLVQDAFIKAFAQLANLQEPQRFGAWLKALTVNLALDRLRRQKKAQPLDDEVLVPDWDGGTQALASLADVEALLLTLGQLDRSLVWLHAVEGYEHSELAGLFAMKEAAVRQRYRRALAKLAQGAQKRGWQDAS